MEGGDGSPPAVDESVGFLVRRRLGIESVLRPAVDDRIRSRRLIGRQGVVDERRSRRWLFANIAQVGIGFVERDDAPEAVVLRGRELAVLVHHRGDFGQDAIVFADYCLKRSSYAAVDSN